MNPDTSSVNAGGVFPSTGWMLIRAVQNRSDPEHQPALDRFARLYWKPAFCFLRASGCPAHEAEDVAQAFFVWLLDGDWIQKADPQRGSFRTFLRMHLRSFLADQTSPRRVPRQKQFERGQLSLEALAGEGERSYEPAAGETPDEAFDRAVAHSLIQTVRQELRKTCETEGRLDWFTIFAATYPDDSATKPLSQEALAEQFSINRNQVRDILDRMKKRCLRLLRNELRDHGGSESDIEAEADELLRLVSR